jgi:DNA-binding SARP family transcriptional activator
MLRDRDTGKVPVRVIRLAPPRGHVVVRVAGAHGRDRLSRMVRLTLMRGFELTCDGHRVVLPHSAQRVIAFLAVTDRPVRRCHAAATLWLESSEERSAGSLRTALWRLRRPDLRLVDLQGDALSLSGDIRVDLRALWDTGRRLLQGDESLDVAALRQLADAGELLPGWYDDWVAMERERIRLLRIQALETASVLFAARGRHGEAAVMALAAVEADPLRESAQQAAIRAQLAAGNRAEALRQYERYTEALRRELQLEPSFELRQLVHTLRQGTIAV